MERLSLRDTIKKILEEHLSKNGILLGECVSDPGGVAGTIPQSKNVIDLPMCEVAGADFAVGCALAGRRPVFVVRFQDFMLMNGSPFIAFAAVTKQLHGLSAPVFIRALANDHFDATHSNVVHSMFMHFPGMCVCAPCTSGEYVKVWKNYMEDDIPYFVSEYRDMYDNTEEMYDVIDENADINVFAISICRKYVYEAREVLLAEGININIINLFFLKPLILDDYIDVMNRVKIGLVVDPGHELCGASEAVAYNLMKQCRGSFIDVLGIEDKIKTTNPHRYNEIPHTEDIVKKIHSLLNK